MSKNEMLSLPIGRIRADAQIRKDFDTESEAGLAQSLREVGLLQPIRVRPDGDGFVIIDGERRWRAAKLAGLTHLDAVVEEQPLSAADVAQCQLIANCQRDDLKPLEAARAVDSLMKATGWSAAQVARKLGLSNAKVTRLLSLLALPEEILRQVEAGVIGLDAGYQLSRAGDPASQAALATEVASGRLTRDALAAKVRRGGKPETEVNGSTANAPARVTAALGRGRSVTLAGPGLQSVETLIDWLSELLAEARKARSQNLELATFARLLRDRSKPARGTAS